MENEFELDDIDTQALIRAILRRKMTIEDIPTFVLCDELARRECTETIWVDPYEEKDIHVEGFATVYIVVD